MRDHLNLDTVMIVPVGLVGVKIPLPPELMAYSQAMMSSHAPDPDSPDTSPQPYHHGELRPALLACARSLLEEDGFEALSLRAVARRAGVSRQAPYHHFADKQALLAAVAAEGFRELAETSRARMRSAAAGRERLNASGIAYVTFAAANPALFQLMFGGGGDGFRTDPDLMAARAESFAVLTGAMEELASPGGAPPAHAALKAWALVHGLADLVIRGVVDPRDLGLADAEALAQAILD